MRPLHAQQVENILPHLLEVCWKALKQDTSVLRTHSGGPTSVHFRGAPLYRSNSLPTCIESNFSPIVSHPDKISHYICIHLQNKDFSSHKFLHLSMKLQVYCLFWLPCSLVTSFQGLAAFQYVIALQYANMEEEEAQKIWSCLVNKRRQTCGVDLLYTIFGHISCQSFILHHPCASNTFCLTDIDHQP